MNVSSFQNDYFHIEAGKREETFTELKRRLIKFNALNNKDCFSYPGDYGLRFHPGNGNLF